VFIRKLGLFSKLSTEAQLQMKRLPIPAAFHEPRVYYRFSIPAALAMEKRPALAGAPVASFGICVFRLQYKARVDGEVQQGFILKADGDRVVFAGGEDLGEINNLALDLFKPVELAAFVTADGGLATLEMRGPIVAFWVWP
jgi:hypothetical protein